MPTCEAHRIPFRGLLCPEPATHVAHYRETDGDREYSLSMLLCTTHARELTWWCDSVETLPTVDLPETESDWTEHEADLSAWEMA